MKNPKLLLVFCLILGMAAYFASCEKKYDSEVIYKGTVINTVTQKPFANTKVKVTDGEHINASVKTDENGQFSILVKFNEINGNYYLLIGDAGCVQVRREFKGFGQSEINLGEIEVEGPKAATITTKPVSNITAESAMSGGNITDDGRAEITARGVCWSKVEYPTISDNHTTNGTGKGEFNSEITGLESGKKYFVRAYATSSAGTSYGEQFSFTTYGVLPIVQTSEVKDIRTSTAKCGGEVLYDGNSAIIACGVCWSSKTSTPTVKDNHTEDFYSVGKYNSILMNLESKTTYFVRAYATNEKGTNYGESKMFTTGNGMPTVETTPVGDNVSENGIVTGGNVVDDGGYDVTLRGVVWATTPYPTVDKNTVVEAGDGVGYFSSTIKDVQLTTGSNCYIRAFATNSVGTSYGEQVIVTKENYDYATLPSMDFQGYHYKIYYMGQLTWSTAGTQCENLVYAGFSDWYFPNYEEVYALYRAGFGQDYIWTSEEYSDIEAYYLIYRYGVGKDSDYKSRLKHVYAVRKYMTE